MKCCEGEEGADGDRKQVYTYFGNGSPPDVIKWCTVVPAKSVEQPDLGMT